MVSRVVLYVEEVQRRSGRLVARSVGPGWMSGGRRHRATSGGRGSRERSLPRHCGWRLGLGGVASRRGDDGGPDPQLGCLRGAGTVVVDGG
jgi:hypothetical protein